MANGNGDGGRSLLSGLGINLVQFASVVAVLYSQWTLMDKSIKDQETASAALVVRVEALSARLYQIEKTAELLALRVNWLETRAPQRPASAPLAPLRPTDR